MKKQNVATGKGKMMSSFPVYPEELTPGFLTDVINELHPGTAVHSAQIVEAKGFGENNVSTSARVTLDLRYAQMAKNMPERVVIKMLKTDDWPSVDIAKGAPAGIKGVRQRPPRYGLYENEVDFYKYIGKDIATEIPFALAARFDHAANRYVLILEDLGERNAHFPSQFDEASVEDVQNLLEALARLHATYWESERFHGDLSWVQTPIAGNVSETIRGVVREGVRDELDRYKFKREILGRIQMTEEQLFSGLDVLQKHQARLPGTLIHGDAHFGNSYRLPDGRAGFYDWQLCARGWCVHDVTYLIVTALSIEQRRKHERDLLRFYREKLLSHGVSNAPDEDSLWLEHRRAIHWCVTIGWMPCPPAAYGWELVVIANNRTSAAYEDLETGKALDDLR